jgi:hypothetical protein
VVLSQSVKEQKARLLWPIYDEKKLLTLLPSDFINNINSLGSTVESLLIPNATLSHQNLLTLQILHLINSKLAKAIAYRQIPTQKHPHVYVYKHDLFLYK